MGAEMGTPGDYQARDQKGQNKQPSQKHVPNSIRERPANSTTGRVHAASKGSMRGRYRMSTSSPFFRDKCAAGPSSYADNSGVVKARRNADCGDMNGPRLRCIIAITPTLNATKAPATTDMEIRLAVWQNERGDYGVLEIKARSCLTRIHERG